MTDFTRDCGPEISNFKGVELDQGGKINQDPTDISNRERWLAISSKTGYREDP
jgi:hypothetical protein